MTGDTNNSQILMSASEVCTLLNLKDSTLRKYCLILMDAGYKFHMNDKGQRGFFEQDVIVVKRFLEAKNSPDMTLEQCAKSVMAWIRENNITLRVTEEEQKMKRHEEAISKLQETVDQQTLLLKKLMEQLEDQQKHINKRDNDLMSAIRSMQETSQAQIAAAQEEKPKQGFFARLFNK
jgi:DNA-binding transcriptional MerR regulator